MSMKIIRNITKRVIRSRRIGLSVNPMHLRRYIRTSKTCKKPTDNCNYQSAGGKESLRLSASIVTKTGGLHKWHIQIAT